MTFNNWKELCIGGNKLKRLVRVSDGLVLFELPSGPDYSEPFWIQGDGVTASSRLYFKATVDPSTLSPILMSYDKKSWTPISWTKTTTDTDEYWMSLIFDNSDSRKRYLMRDSEVPIGFCSDAGIDIDYKGYYTKPSSKLGGNINSLLCKNFSALTDISGLDKCFFGFLYAPHVVTNIDQLLLPSKQISLSCYQLFSGYNGDNTLNTSLSSAGFTLDLDDIPSYGCYRMFRNTQVVNGPKFPNLKSVGDYGLAQAFQKCSSLTSVELPSTPISVGTYGFNYTFSESGIKTVENLSLSGIENYGCEHMFSSCSALEKVDGLSAENFSAYALSGMFSKCSSLTSVQDLHIDNSEDTNKKNGTSKCDGMFDGCKSLLSVGGLIKGVYGQYALRNVFRNCKSLKDASQLSVELNYGNRYAQGMFENCSELESMPVLLSGDEGTGLQKCLYMFRNCTKLKNVNPLPYVRPFAGIYSQMFQNCTSMTDAPEIMLSSANQRSCMTNMFNGCTSLSSVTVHFTTWPSTAVLNGWLSGVAPTGIFRCPAELTDQRGNGRIPEGWTKVDL